MIFQKGMKLQFQSGGDFTRVPRVQIATSGDDTRIPSIKLDGGDRVKKVQVVSGGDPSRIPKVQIPNLAAWFKFNVGITVTGAGVSQWDDMSGNGRHLKQGTDGNRPAKQADGSILFDGVAGYLKCDAFTINQPETVYVLGRQISWTSADYWCDGNSTNGCAILQRIGSPSLGLFAGSFDIANNGLALNTYGCVAAVFHGTSSLLQINNSAAQTGNPGTNNSGGFTLGSQGNGISGFGNIQVKEVLIFSGAHGAEDRASVIRYLASVGGLSI